MQELQEKWVLITESTLKVEKFSKENIMKVI